MRCIWRQDVLRSTSQASSENGWMSDGAANGAAWLNSSARHSMRTWPIDRLIQLVP